mgnify:FL=1|jgi:serine/threonine protein kinase
MFDKRKPLPQGWELVFGEEHRYVIAEEIGRGGSCIVYNGFYRDRIGERHLVKIKECYPYRLEIERDAGENLTPDLSCKQTFLAEKQKFLEAYRKNTALKTTLGLVNSTANATNIYEYHNTCYVVMTEIEGRDYRSEADENLQSLFLHLRTLVRIVKKYHDCGMLHLDIKPENVLLIPETKEQMVLFDFDSMVRKEKIQTQPNSWTFSVSDGYAAPELVRGKCSKICEATDVYAIGAIAFYKLFGRTPNAMDSAVGAIYDFSGMKWKDARYQPVLFRLMQEFFHRTLAATVRRRYASVDEVLEILEKLIRESDVERVFLYHGFAYNTANFVGRENELRQIETIFSSGQQVLFLSGMGGIGKTELAKRYAYLYGEEYRTIVFVPYQESIVQTVCGEDIHIHNVHREQSEEGLETEEEYFERKLKILKEQTTKDNLIILDNFDVEEDEDLERFLECPCRFLITTREDFRDYDFCQIDVQQMEDINDVEALFAVYNPRSYEEEERGQIREILKLVEYHTMTVELIAKYLREAEEEPYVLLEKMRMIEGITGTEEVSVKHRKDRKMQNQKVQEHLQALFDLSGFSNVQLELMQSLSLLGYVRIARETFLSYVPFAGAKEALDKLIRLGWVEHNKKTDKISLHQIILDLVYHDSKPTAESCPAITEKMTAYARQDLESSALDEVRWQFLKYFMERISGENLAYARLCVAYCGHIHNEMHYLKQAEKICRFGQEKECHALLFRIYLLQIRKVGKKDDLIDRMMEEDFDENRYLQEFQNQIYELAGKAEREIQSDTEDVGILGKSMIDLALEVNDALEDDLILFPPQEKENEEVYHQLLKVAVHFMDKAEQYLDQAEMDKKEKAGLYKEMAKFFRVDEFEMDVRKEYYGDQRRAHFYREKAAELTKNEEISEENEEIVFGEMPGFSEVAEELEKKGEYFQAIECYVKAYDQDEISYVRALEQIAENRVRLKEMEEAANCWKRILEAERKREEWFQYDGGICCRLIQFLRERGQTDEARRYAMELVQYYTSKEEQEDDHDWSCRLAGMYRLYQLETDEKRREDYWKQCETCWQHISDDYRIFEENRAYLLERLGREKTEEKRIEQAFAYMQHRTSWMDAEDNLVFLDYILKQTKGKEKFAAQEIRAFLYRSRCYLELAGNHKKEAMWDAFAALKRQKQVKNQDAYLRSFGYKMLAICYRDRYSVLDKRAEKLLEKCDYFLMTKTDAKGQKTEQQLEIWEDAARSYRDRKEDPMEEKCYQQMELLFQEMQTKGTEPRYETYKCFAEDRARCAGRQKQFQNVLQIIRKAYTLTLHEYQTPKPEDAWPNYDEETRKYYFSRDLEHYADILAEIGLQQEAFVFYSMSVIVSVEDQQDATFFDSLDVYFAGEWELLYKTFEAALHQNVTEEQIDRLSDIMDYLQYDEMKDFWNGNKTTDFRRELTWFVDTYCHGEIEFKREE